MTDFQQIVVALLVAIHARTYLPPLGSESTSNRTAVVIVSLSCYVWAALAGAKWAGLR